MRLLFLFPLFFLIGCGTSSNNKNDSLTYKWHLLKLSSQDNQISGSMEFNTSSKYHNVEISYFSVYLKGCNNILADFAPDYILNKGILNFNINIPINSCVEGKKDIVINAVESVKNIDSELRTIKKEIYIDIPVYLYKKGNNMLMETNETKFNEIMNSINMNEVSDKVTNINILRTDNPMYDSKTGLINLEYTLQLIGNKGNDFNLRGDVSSGIIVNNKLNKILDNGVLLGNEATNAVFKDNNVDFYKYFIQEGDELVILPNSEKNNPNYLGNWEITKIINKNMLELNDKSSYTETNLSYIIGNDRKAISNQLLSATINTIEKNSSKGFFKVSLSYSPELSGHTGVIYSKFKNSFYHIGNAKKIKFLPLDLSVWVDNNQNCINNYNKKSVSVCEWEINESTNFVLNYKMNLGYSDVIAKKIPIDIRTFKSDNSACSIKINGISLNNPKTDTIYTDENGNLNVEVIDSEINTSCTITYVPEIGYEY